MRGARNQTLTCTNCGGVGHLFRQCIAPVMSYGVIMARARQGRDFSITKTLSTTYDYVTGLESQPLEFLLIQRRDSLGFIELMRGRYRVNDVDYMILHMKRITADPKTPKPLKNQIIKKRLYQLSSSLPHSTLLQ
jgi:hypothetical protein